MKLYIWIGRLGTIAIVYANSIDEAKKLLTEKNKSYLEYLSTLIPIIIDSPASFVVWADVYNIEINNEKLHKQYIEYYERINKDE